MGKTFKDAVAKNLAASEELDKALRECLAEIREDNNVVVEGRFRVIAGGRGAISDR